MPTRNSAPVQRALLAPSEECCNSLQTNKQHLIAGELDHEAKQRTLPHVLMSHEPSRDNDRPTEALNCSLECQM